VNDWVKEASVAVTVCGADGVITEMNLKACGTFAKSGGPELIGKNLLDCHPEPSKSKVRAMLSASVPVVNAYTIEKNGVKKLIYQMPRTINGKAAGLVELSLELPPEMPHFVRK
jgi:hypothetical protein